MKKYTVLFSFETVIEAESEEQAVNIANTAAMECGFQTSVWECTEPEGASEP